MQRIFLTALFAGFFAGLFVFGLQSFKLTPLILQAETYEEAAAEKEDAAEDHHHGAHADAHEHHHDADEWEPANGFERNAWRLVADLGVGIGFALLLVGAFTLRGDPMDTKRGMIWGMSGFAVFSLAPGFGLPPELPTTMAAELGARQAWWLATAAATACGIALIAFHPKTLWKALGMGIMIAPQLIGAPNAPLGGVVPTELNAAFASAALGTMALFWVVLGALSGYFYDRLGKKNAA